MRRCSRCGKEAADELSFCTRCGRKFPIVIGVPSPSSPSDAKYVPLTSEDVGALGKIRNFSILAMLASASSVFALLSLGLSGVSVLAASILGLGLQVASLLFLRSGFKDLSKADPLRFHFSPSYALIYVMGQVGLSLAENFLSGSSTNFAQVLFPGLAGGGTDYASSLAYLTSFLLFGIVGLLGLLGVVQSIWRAGVRYGRGTVRIGSLMYALPLISLGGAFLIFLELGSISRESGGVAPAASQSGSFPQTVHQVPPQVSSKSVLVKELTDA